MSSSFYLLQLVSVGRNSATFGVFSGWVRGASDTEVRRPSLVDPDTTKKAMDSLDKATALIDNWTDFYAWLGRGKGWATFTPESAAELVPTWLSQSVEFTCVKFEDLIPWVRYVEDPTHLTMLAALRTRVYGRGTDDQAYRNLVELADNLVLVTRPIFPSN